MLLLLIIIKILPEITTEMDIGTGSHIGKSKTMLMEINIYPTTHLPAQTTMDIGYSITELNGICYYQEMQDLEMVAIGIQKISIITQ